MLNQCKDGTWKMGEITLARNNDWSLNWGKCLFLESWSFPPQPARKGPTSHIPANGQNSKFLAPGHCRLMSCFFVHKAWILHIGVMERVESSDSSVTLYCSARHFMCVLTVTSPTNTNASVKAVRPQCVILSWLLGNAHKSENTFALSGGTLWGHKCCVHLLCLDAWALDVAIERLVPWADGRVWMTCMRTFALSRWWQCLDVVIRLPSMMANTRKVFLLLSFEGIA